MNADVVIVGAGAAGLMAARELAKAGKRAVILEARDRIGGRIYPLSEAEFGYPAQGGAEYVHGAAPVTMELLKEDGITTEHAIEWWDARDGEPALVDFGSGPDARAPEDRILLERLDKLTEDMSIADFFAKHFSEEEYQWIRDVTQSRLERYDAADITRASALAFRDELRGGDATALQRQFKEGYGKVLRELESEIRASGVEILTSTRVVAIDTSEEGVRVTTDAGQVWQCASAVVTVPLPLIKEIAFTPEQPEKYAAAEMIGFGPAIKILLRFNTKWWAGIRERKFERMFFMFSNEAIPSWWTQYPEPPLTLTGWAAGPQAAALAGKSDSELIELALQSLSNIFTISREELSEHLMVAKVNNWAADPYARGAYSYATPESAAAIKELMTPVDHKLYFAGEALYEGEVGGTVEAALVSGRDVARSIVTSA